MSSQFRIVEWARRALQFLRCANLVFLLVFILMLLLSLILYGRLAHQISLKHPALDPHSSIVGLRLLVGMGIALVGLNDRFLGALLHITESARLKDPFIATNVRRLRVIGFTLLAMQLVGIGIGALASAFSIPAEPFSTPSLTGCLSVLMAFVLAEVFAVGTAMREEQQGTI